MSQSVRTRAASIVSELVPICGSVSIAQKAVLTDAIVRLVTEEAWKAHGIGRDWATEYLHCKFDAAMTARDKMVAIYGPNPAAEPRP